MLFNGVSVSLVLTAVILSVGTVAAPSPDAETITLFNGQDNVQVKTGFTTESQRSAAIPALIARNNLTCKGSAFCGRLGSSCDDAFRQVTPENTFFTGGSARATGTCSGTCGLFVSGPHCTFRGTDLIAAYQEIRAQGCKHCGMKIFDNGCRIKIDRITGC